MEGARPSELAELHAAVEKSEAALLLQDQPSAANLAEHSALCRRLCRALRADGQSELAEAYAERADALDAALEQKRTSPRPASRRKDVAAEAREKANPYSRPWTVHQKRHHLTRAARSPSRRSKTPSPRRGRNGDSNPRAAERFRDVEERHSVHHRARPTSLERLASPTRSRQDSRTLRRTAEAMREEGYVGEKTLGEALAMHSHGYKRTGAESPFEDAEPAYEDPSYEDLPQVRLEQQPRYMNAVEQSLEQGKQRAESRKMRAEEAAAEKAERRVREEETVAARKARADYDTRKQRARSAPKSKGRRRRRGAPSCYVSQKQMEEQQAGLQQRRRDAERQAEQEESRQKWGADVRRLWTLFIALNDQVSYGAEASDDEALCGVLLEHKGLALSRGQCQRLIELLRADTDADEVVSQLTETFELGRSWSQAMRTGRAQQQATQRRMDEWEQARREKVESERTRQEEQAAAELLETPLPPNSFAKRAGDTGSAAVSRRSTSPTASVRSGSSTSSRHHAHTSASLEKGTKGALEAELRRQAEWRAAANPSLDHSFAARAASPAPSEDRRRPLSTQVTLLLTKLRSLSYSANGQSPEKLFNHFDRNNSGVLEEREFLQGVHDLERRAQLEDDMRATQRVIDVVRKGGALTKEAISDSDIKLLFRALDKDRDGVISVEELRGFVWGGPEEAEAAVRRVEEGRARVVAPLPLSQALSAPRSLSPTSSVRSGSSVRSSSSDLHERRTVSSRERWLSAEEQKERASRRRAEAAPDLSTSKRSFATTFAPARSKRDRPQRRGADRR